MRRHPQLKAIPGIRSRPGFGGGQRRRPPQRWPRASSSKSTCASRHREGLPREEAKASSMTLA